MCLALVLLAGTVSITHSHGQGDLTHADCGLCAAAHAVVQVSAAPVSIPVAQVQSAIESNLPPVRARDLIRFALFTRPPPASAELS
jgi:hypothetical protein